MAEHSPATSGPAPLRSALKSDGDGDRTPPASGTLKAVQIAEPVPDFDDESQSIKTFRAGPSRRLSGKPASSKSSISEGSPALRTDDDSAPSSSHHHSQRHHQYYAEKLLAQVADWLEHEKRKKIAAAKPKPRRKSKSPPDQDRSISTTAARERSDSVDSQSSDVSFEKLEHILQDSLASLGLSSIPQHPPKLSRRRRANSKPSLNRTASSDTDYVDGDAIVPSCDVWLDNSKTMSYTGGAANESDSTSGQAEENDPWLIFKNDIIRIAHTLRLKGWRRIPLNSGDTITVERLSGALTNAVYVVTPPMDLPEIEGKKNPPKLLLRVYGPQVEHLIDRENELKVLQRLARKKIGPRLLGTFQNGRFEQFFNSITLTPVHLREPDTSKQIAKRMRELHDGIELLPLERDGGPGVWKNWDQWVENVAKIMAYLDKQLETTSIPPAKSDSVVHAWKANGYVCGAPWEQFLAMVVKYRTHLVNCYKPKKIIKERLVFAHNDTQYGNILRIKPDDEKSPLLQPANKHKQLVVIDFEYAGANLPGLEFANHFTEWTYNYHDPVTSHACNHERYPTPEEQRRFIKSYVDHRSQFAAAGSTPRVKPDSGPPTPSLNPTASSSSIVDFMLDARVPPGGWGAAERAREEQSDLHVRQLLEETRLWRPACSVFWIAWGIVQAKVPGLDANNEPVSEEEAAKAEQELGPDEFDYLSYAQNRAFFFWGDCVQMGLVKPEELPEKLRSNLKIIDY
ncbi:aminoglycoside 3'-phosphotransferase/choline kinase domain protein [Metarhizium robertsii]|uniref:Choline kinase n=2 Tax=Metarhizium robertsii TaxID=568076 RepID=E9F840_METRA|nr:choline kinase [Metarhizium robertsii ARSEF 23]EFY96132.1 choline kinase [Metarhizium robertsii ARSEF 23]EXU98343.1 aminoglycoside 3'-phosphotransferase/choline kinase domain protein [Metarhizium robertsii]